MARALLEADGFDVVGLREEVVRPQRTIKGKENYTLPSTLNL